MAKQSVGIGSAANDGTGDPLRTAFDKINDNTDELYALLGNGTTLSISGDVSVSAGAVTIADDAIAESNLDVTNSPVDGYVLTYDSASSGFTWEQKFDGDITGIVAGNGLTGDATSGDASLAVGAGTGITVNADDIQIANDGVDHDQLAARYTASGSITTYTGAVTVDWSAATNFVMGSALTGAIEFDFTNFKTGQVLTIHNLTGSQTITLDSNAATSETFNKLGGNDYDGSATNALMIECISDSANAVFNYSVLTYVSDTTPS